RAGPGATGLGATGLGAAGLGVTELGTGAGRDNPVPGIDIEGSIGNGAPQVAQKLLPGVLIRPQLGQVKTPLATLSSFRTALPPAAIGTTGGAAFTGAGAT